MSTSATRASSTEPRGVISQFLASFPPPSGFAASSIDRQHYEQKNINFLDEYGREKCGRWRTFGEILTDVEDICDKDSKTVFVTWNNSESPMDPPLGIQLTGYQSRTLLHGSVMTAASANHDYGTVALIEVLRALDGQYKQPVTKTDIQSMRSSMQEARTAYPQFEGDMKRLSEALEQATSLQETLRAFKIDLSAVSSMQRPPALVKFLKDKEARKELKEALRSIEASANAINLNDLTARLNPRYQDAISRSLATLLDLIRAEENSVAQRRHSSAAYIQTEDQDTLRLDWLINKRLFKAVLQRDLTVGEEVSLMSPSYKAEYQQYILGSESKIIEPSARERLCRLTEHYMMDDPDMAACTKSLALLPETCSLAERHGVVPSQIKSEVRSLIQNPGDHLVLEASKRRSDSKKGYRTGLTIAEFNETIDPWVFAKGILLRKYPEIDLTDRKQVESLLPPRAVQAYRDASSKAD
ncbi:uncharacterized protein I206_104057 [Kwoniella pini CBS 10737]|uniref:Uncharacterized protein n=1 Tax=Kwoniella pini CBS 10737 TaxID=1296096 RepID=A0A1B9I2R0_9TREE|nr:uncharacterized protein I206_04367 [Kwoniella pini CBS 10737]OCF49840.1 hypothetical protein I206_04367 [Kwoniella pini CBS 10737]